MGQIQPGNRTYGEYQSWLNSPEGQKAAQAERAQVQSRKDAGGPQWLSSDGMVQPPSGWSSGQQSPQGGFDAYKQSTPQGNYSAYSPSQARPQQQSFGTPYNPQQGGNFSAYQQQPTSTAQMPQWASQMPMGGQNFGMPAFQFRATDFMGNQYSNPSAFTAQQGAMVQALNQQRAGQIGNLFTQGQPMTPLNPQMAYDQGMQMLQGGFQNPFMDPSVLSPQPFDLRSGLSDLFGRGGMQIQPGVMDQILGLLNPQAPPRMYQPMTPGFNQQPGGQGGRTIEDWEAAGTPGWQEPLYSGLDMFTTENIGRKRKEAYEKWAGAGQVPGSPQQPGDQQPVAPQPPGGARPVQPPSQGTPYNPQDHRTAYEQQQQTAARARERESLVHHLGIKAQGDVSDAAILRAMFPSGGVHPMFRGTGPESAAQRLARAGIISQQEAAQINREAEMSGANDWLQKNLRAGKGGRIDGLQGGGWTLSQGVTADMHARAAADRWNTEHGLAAQLPKLAEYMEFLVNERGVPQAEARRLAEQQYPTKSYGDEFRRLAAAGDHDQISIMQYGMTEAERRQRQMADEAREQKAVLAFREKTADLLRIRAQEGDLEAQQQLQRESSAVKAAQDKLRVMNAAAERAKKDKWGKHTGPTKAHFKEAEKALKQALADAAAGRGQPRAPKPPSGARPIRPPTLKEAEETLKQALAIAAAGRG